MHTKQLRVLLFLFLSGSTLASGFQLFEGNASNISDFGAGGAANTLDASATLYNPANLVHLKHTQVAFTNSLVKFNADFRGNVFLRDNLGANVMAQQNAFEQGGKLSYVPSLQVAGLLKPRWAFGFGLHVPFGLSTNWSETSAVRYSGTESQITALNLGPVLAYEVSSLWSIGGGVDFQFLKAQLNSSVSSHVVGVPAIVGDNQLRNQGSSLGYGWNLGVSVHPHRQFHMAAFFRSFVAHHLTGSSEFSGPLALRGTIKNDLGAQIVLPATFNISVLTEINPKTSLMGSIYYTFWNSIKSIDLKNVASPGGPVEVSLPQNFKNTLRYALGAQYAWTENWFLKTGIGFDQSPTNQADKTVRLPDGDRIGVSVGFKYLLNRKYALDVGYTRIFLKEPKLNYIQRLGTLTNQIDGRIISSAHLLSLQWTMNLN